MKKILIISSQYPSTENQTVGIYVEEQALELSKKNEILIIVTTNKKNKKTKYENRNGIKIIKIHYFSKYFIISPIFYYFNIKKKLSGIIKKYKPDIIHIHDYKHIPEIFTLYFILKKNINKVIVTLHNVKQLYDTRNITVYFYRLLFIFIINKYPKKILVSSKVYKKIIRYSKIKNYTIIGNGINENYLKLEKNILSPYLYFNNKTFNILAVGNLIKSKGVNFLIDSLSTLTQENYNVTLTIIGTGSEYNKLLWQIKKLLLNKYVFFTGQLNHNIVMNLYKYFDLFALPSWDETFGIVYLEAMFHKLPIIGIQGEGINDVIVNEKNGILIKPKSSYELTENIKHLINNKDFYNKISENGYRTIMKKWTLEKICIDIENYYEK